MCRHARGLSVYQGEFLKEKVVYLWINVLHVYTCKQCKIIYKCFNVIQISQIFFFCCGFLVHPEWSDSSELVMFQERRERTAILRSQILLVLLHLWDSVLLPSVLVLSLPACSHDPVTLKLSRVTFSSNVFCGNLWFYYSNTVNMEYFWAGISYYFRKLSKADHEQQERCERRLARLRWATSNHMAF